MQCQSERINVERFRRQIRFSYDPGSKSDTDPFDQNPDGPEK